MSLTNIYVQRKSKGLTIEGMAKKAGVSVSKYRKIESGEQTSDSTTAETIARVLEVPIYQLLVPIRYTARKVELERREE
jgi:transcriptional regulator with XRE-family HTH domain